MKFIKKVAATRPKEETTEISNSTEEKPKDD